MGVFWQITLIDQTACQQFRVALAGNPVKWPWIVAINGEGATLSGRASIWI